MSSSDSYNQAIENTGETLARFIKPIWAVVKHTPWASNLLGTMFKWGALCSDVPCAIVPLSASPSDAINAVRRIILQKRQIFPLLKKYLWYICRKHCPDGLSGYQANVATNLAISKLIGDGFVAFHDQARLYPQYANSYMKKLNEHWPDWTLERMRSTKPNTIIALGVAWGSEYSKPHLTPEHRVRAQRADKRLQEAYAYQDQEIRLVRKWLSQKYPHLDWTQWHGSSFFWDARETLEKVNAYIGRKDSARELREALKHQRQVNDERLKLWRDWWANTVRALVAGRNILA